jgi:hypothetical protein
MLLGRARFEQLMGEADRSGLSMATVVRHAVDHWMAQPPGRRSYQGPPQAGVIDLDADPAAPRPLRYQG